MTMKLDPLTEKERSERMSRIRSSNTKPELIVRRLVYHSGFRYRKNVMDLPGHPDLVFKTRRKIIFVHGCFWHQHGCGHYLMPKSRTEYWLPKLEKNVARDKQILSKLVGNGWEVLIIWECEIKDIPKLSEKIRGFLLTEK